MKKIIFGILLFVFVIFILSNLTILSPKHDRVKCFLNVVNASEWEIYYKSKYREVELQQSVDGYFFLHYPPSNGKIVFVGSLKIYESSPHDDKYIFFINNVTGKDIRKSLNEIKENDSFIIEGLKCYKMAFK